MVLTRPYTMRRGPLAPHRAGVRGGGPASWSAIVVAAVLGVATLAVSAQNRRTFSVVEATIPDMRRAMEQGRVTSCELVQQSAAVAHPHRPPRRRAQRHHHGEPACARGGG